MYRKIRDISYFIFHISYLLLLCSIATVGAAEIHYKNMPLEVTFETKGGGIKKLMWENKQLTCNGGISFTERVMANCANPKSQMQELFGQLEFTLNSIQRDWRELNLEFSARGTGAFDWMRLTKVYRYKHNGGKFTIDYTLENLDRVPHNAGVWIQTFLRDCSEEKSVNTHVQGERPAYNHPGNPVMDDWQNNAQRNFTAVYGKDSGFGALVEMTAACLSDFYNWSDRAKYFSTVELLSRCVELKPGKKLSFTLTVTPGKNIPGKVAALLRSPLKKSEKIGTALNCAALYAAGKQPEIKLIQSRGGLTVKPSANSMSINVPRQFNNSVREVILPDKANLNTTSICEVHNGVADDSREVPFIITELNGKKILRFAVPGIGYDYHGMKRTEKRDYVHVNYGYICPLDYPVEIRFDRAPKGKYDASRLKEADLFDNTDFSRLDKNGRPEGWVFARIGWYRKWFSMENGALVMIRKSAKDQYVQFSEHFRLEPDRKYKFTMEINDDNPIKGVAAGSIHFYDAQGKLIPNARVYVYDDRHQSMPWKTITKEFYTPEKAVAGFFTLVVYGIKDQKISFKKVSVTPEPYSPVTVKLVDRLRDQLKSNWYKPLDLIERNDTDVVTPHEKWLKPAAFTMPEVLFLPLNFGNYTSLERRRVVELAQRMSLKYTILSLLERVSFINGNMGVNINTYASELEPYTLERLRLAPQYKVIAVTDVNFKQDVKAPFINWLKERAEKSNLLFINCLNIPKELLGKAEPIPDEIKQIPVLAPYPQWQNVLTLYTRGDLRSAALDYRFARKIYFPSVPQSESYNMYPGFTGRNFPYWEFQYLTCAKVLRHIAGVKPDAVITAVKPESIAIQAEKAVKARLEIRYDTLFRQTCGTVKTDLILKPGLNTVPLAPVSFGGECIANVKLYQDEKVLDAAGAKFSLPEKAKITVTFPKGSTIPYGKNMAVEIKSEGADGVQIEAQIEDAGYRIVKRATVSGKEMKLDFSPAFPRTTMYRLLVQVRNQQGEVIARQMREMTFSGVLEEPDELIAVSWPGSDTLKYPIWKELGFDHMVIGSDGRREFGAVRELRNLNLEPSIFGLGGRGFPNWRAYKYLSKDRIRKPCFSDPEAWQKANAAIAEQAKLGQYTHYDVKYHFMGDEQFIGTHVCFSPHCLKNFRALMQKQYGNIHALNKAYGTNYTTFDEIMPVLLENLKDKSKLAPFVDHKLYICSVFADTYMGGFAREIKKAAPASVIGLSGTDKPGYSFDWGLVMRHLDYLACYDGSQRKLARDFAKPGAIIGQWFGGYVLPTPHEGYINTFFWRDLLQGGRMSPNWTPRAGITGDLKLTPQLTYHSKLIKEARKGIAKLVLNSTETPVVGMVYSQSSLFAAAATIGLNEYQNSLEGWHALLGDLGIDYKFFYAPEVPEKLDNRFKVLILPGMISISDAELKKIREFAANGGTVIADMVPAYDGHGTLRYGCRVPNLVSFKKDGIDFRKSDAEAPLMKVEKIGKGKFITFNLAVSGYQQIALGGVGGETSQVKSGSEKFCDAMRKLVTDELAKAGIRRNRTLTGKEGKPRQAETVWRNFANCKLFGIWLADTDVPVLKPDSGEPVTVKLPEKGHIYDVRNGRYVGYGDTFTYQLYPACADLFAVLKEKPGSIALKADSEVKSGSNVNFSVELPGCGRIFHCELKDSTGKVCYQRNLAAPQGKAKGSFQIAFNDKPGNWTLVVNDCATKVSTQQKIKVR